MKYKFISLFLLILILISFSIAYADEKVDDDAVISLGKHGETSEERAERLLKAKHVFDIPVPLLTWVAVFFTILIVGLIARAYWSED